MATQTLKGTTTFGAANGGDTFYILDGGMVISGNLDYSGVNTCVVCEVAKGFTGDIGTSANSFLTAFSTRLVYGAGGGNMYFDSNALDTETTALIQCIGNGHFHFVGGSTGIATRFEAIGGMVTVSNGPTLTTARFGGNVQASLLDTGSGTSIVTLDVTGGSVYSERPHTTINAHRGILVLNADQANGVNAHTTINVNGAAVTINDSGTIGTLNWNAGTVDAAKLTRPLTISASTINMSLPGAAALLNHPLITFSSNTKIYTDGRQL